MFNPGRLTERITIQRRSVTTTSGKAVETWTDAFAVWSEAEEVRGSRALQMDGYTAVARARFWVRDNALTQSVSTETHRVRWAGRVWTIESNARLAIERGMREMFCQEAVGE